MSALERGTITCVACGMDHIGTEEQLAGATRIGVSFVARECAWTLRYPGMEAHQVIEQLERATGGTPPAPEPALVAADESPFEEPIGTGDAEAETDIERLAAMPGITAGTRVPCSVCHGDGEIGDPPVPCGRCGGDGTIVVTG